MTLDEFRARRRTFTRVIGVAEVDTDEHIREQSAAVIAGCEVLLTWAADGEGGS